MKVSNVSVSRLALAPQFEQVVFTNLDNVFNGEPGSSSFIFSGNTTGKSCSGTGTIPHLEQYIIGIGAPQ